ncbi:Vegetative incompatibility protein HET-E-1 [Colletotrichum siamense]|uniref:Vegetative incompatibility protein HET-E-1 n=1 Tax=Colletotrichum siamense TaxID=690259 RepID=UPI001872EFF0|nr:Vegetative incompatibility protein HET-E-1 [Colletotrichum siamense]KAF5497212.1 Vegetative incompatibility protein HET-E-1 [Colletotrichum siamense]
MQYFAKLRKKHRSKRTDGPSSTNLESETPPTSLTTPTPVSALSEFPVNEMPTTTIAPVSISLQDVRKQIWNDAYDEAKKDEPKIFEQYEQILSVHLRETSNRTSDAENGTNAIKQDTLGRQLQMTKLVEMGLEKTEKSAMAKGKIKEGMQPVLNIKEFVATAVKSEPTAAIAWVGVMTCMDIITNPVTEPGVNRDGVKFVLERSRWHWELTQLLLDIRKTDTSLTELQTQLKAHIARLYKKLLLYQIQSVVLYNRRLVGVLIRDVFKVDDWQQKIDAILGVEEALRKDVEQHNSEELKGRLRDIDSTLKDLRLDIKAVETAVEQQTRVLHKLHHDDKDKECLARLCVINPETHKAKIQRTGGGLLKDSYEWILDHEDFQRFRSNPESRLLWIRGDPGKGKTMLLCGIIDELKNESSRPLTYAFCQATHGDFRSATSVLRSLIWLLCKDHPELVSHVRERYDVEGETPLKDITALQSILGQMLGETYLRDAVLLVDALDEYLADRTELIDIISDFSGSFPAKWIVSSRNWPDINGQLQHAQKDILSLELNNDAISQAVSVFVEHKAKELALRKRYSPTMQEAVLKTLLQKARDTFIWVALVCAELDRVPERHTMAHLKSIPGDLTRLYDRMLDHAVVSRDADSCQNILRVACITFRPLTLSELQVLVEELGDHSHDVLREIVGECGSFLTIQEDTVYFIHQSAKDFLIQQGKDRLSHLSSRDLHHQLFVRSLSILMGLKRNPYNLDSPGVLASDIVRPESDPLASLEYSCVYWIDHCNELGDARALSDDKRIEVFARKSFLHWLEALSIFQEVPEAVKGIQTLAKIMGDTANHDPKKIVDDMRRFVLLHIDTIRIAPLQIYNSALVFCPFGSTIRGMFEHEEPDWIRPKPNIPSNWETYIQTIELDFADGGIVNMQFSEGNLLLLTEWSHIIIWD